MKLPPLNALKSFEAAVRLGGFTAAAAELDVTPAAVSLQVKNAEKYLGKTLFHRKNNALILTDAGQQIYPFVAEALTAIATITEQVMGEDHRARLVVSSVQSLTERHIGPAIAELHHLYPDIGIELRVEQDPVDLQKQRVDLRVTTESHHYPASQTQVLFRDAVRPFASDWFWSEFCPDGRLDAIPVAHFIHTEWGESHVTYPGWADWFRTMNMPVVPDPRRGLRVDSAALAMSLARQGAGVALVPESLLTKEPNAQQQPVLPALELPFAFYAVTPPAHESLAQRNEVLIRELIGLIWDVAGVL